MAKIYAAETPVLEMGIILRNKLSPLRVKTDKIFSSYIIQFNYTIIIIKIMYSNNYDINYYYQYYYII